MTGIYNTYIKYNHINTKKNTNLIDSWMFGQKISIYTQIS